MNICVTARVKALIEETGHAYDICHETQHINMDFADFAATMSYSAFNEVLSHANLTQRQLKHMIRRGVLEHRKKDPDGCWKAYLSHYIADTTNTNKPKRVRRVKKWDSIVKESVR